MYGTFSVIGIVFVYKYIPDTRRRAGRELGKASKKKKKEVWKMDQF